MKRIGVTQRVEVVPSYGERRDCLDQQWHALLESIGLHVVPVPNRLNEPGTWLNALALDGFVLSGGNDLCSIPNPSNPAPERDRTEREILSHAVIRKLPVLGVCRGLQMINTHLGGRLTRIEGHVATRHTVEQAAGEPLFSGQREVNSFHGLGILDNGLAKELTSLASADDGSIEAFRHRELPWIGIMWHPERENPFLERDLAILKSLFEA